MKRIHAMETTFFWWLPDEVWLEIFDRVFPQVGKNPESLCMALVMRNTCWHMRRLIDSQVFGSVKEISSGVMRALYDGQMKQLVLFTDAKKLAIKVHTMDKVYDDQLQKMRSVEELVLCDYIRGAKPTGLNGFTRLKSLTICYANARHGDEIAALTQLEGLCLSEAALTRDRMNDSHLAPLTCLQSLRLCFMDDIKGECLRHMPHLTSLDLGPFCALLSNHLADVARQLTSLFLHCTEAVSNSLLLQMTNLKALYLQRNETICGPALRQMTQLTTLSLDLCNATTIRDADIAALTQLKRLSLVSFRPLTGEFLRSLAHCLETVVIEHPLPLFVDLAELKCLRSLAYSYRDSQAHTREELETMSLLRERGVAVDSRQ